MLVPVRLALFVTVTAAAPVFVMLPVEFRTSVSAFRLPAIVIGPPAIRS